MVFWSVAYDFKIISIMPWHTLESCATYWVGFDITCLKQNPTKGLTNFKEWHNTTEVRAMVRNAKLEPLSMMYVITCPINQKTLVSFSLVDTPPNFLRNPNVGPKVKQWKRKKIKAHYLTYSISKVESMLEF
jgi:hypothetical protein